MPNKCTSCFQEEQYLKKQGLLTYVSVCTNPSCTMSVNLEKIKSWELFLGEPEVPFIRVPEIDPEKLFFSSAYGRN